MKVCFTCGVEVALAKSGRWVHTDAIPPTSSDHDAQPVTSAEFAVADSSFVTLRQAAADMLVHHSSGHPKADCVFAQNLEKALR